ncbi:MAG: hypothetical protein J1D85_08605, partial [Bacteroidales bacterium]|nr:hypothetical protein [Bacteroidales bacterium]
HKRSLTIEKVDAGTGAPVPNTTFHVRGVNVAYENDVTTGAGGKVTLTELPSGCYEVTEINVPSPYILDSNSPGQDGVPPGPAPESCHMGAPERHARLFLL